MGTLFSCVNEKGWLCPNTNMNT